AFQRLFFPLGLSGQQPLRQPEMAHPAALLPVRLRHHKRDATPVRMDSRAAQALDLQHGARRDTLMGLRGVSRGVLVCWECAAHADGSMAILTALLPFRSEASTEGSSESGARC